jgi:UDP-N-acetylmuramate: L-alanyl-gamma-D-glutamyl-meso-diaminopimelate ligase
MKNTSQGSPPVRSAYLIGIGGVGMSALAGLLREKGYKVSGSDQAVYPPASTTLHQLAISVYTPFDAGNVPDHVDVVVVGNACSRGHPEIEVMLNRGMRYRSLPEILKEEFLWDRKSLVVAGTHGKTTTSAMLSWLLQEGGRRPSFFVGGAPKNFPQPFRLDEGEDFVIEGDEYDSAFFDKRAKFLHYRPWGAILGPIEFDHCDIYGDIQDIELAFSRLLLLLPNNGILVASGDHERVRSLAEKANCQVILFGCEAGNDWRAVDIAATECGMAFQLIIDGVDKGEFRIGQWGRYNVINMLGAMAMAYQRGVSIGRLRRAAPGFLGVARRMEELGTVGGITFIDDFAHHPTAITETLIGVRAKYPNRRIVAIFEPRSNTSVRKVFQSEIAHALQNADEIFIGPIYRSNRIPKEDILDVKWIKDYLESRGKSASYWSRFNNLLTGIQSRIRAGDVIVFMSNGSLGGIVPRLLSGEHLDIQAEKG